MHGKKIEERGEGWRRAEVGMATKINHTANQAPWHPVKSVWITLQVYPRDSSQQRDTNELCRIPLRPSLVNDAESSDPKQNWSRSRQTVHRTKKEWSEAFLPQYLPRWGQHLPISLLRSMETVSGNTSYSVIHWENEMRPGHSLLLSLFVKVGGPESYPDRTFTELCNKGQVSKLLRNSVYSIKK